MLRTLGTSAALFPTGPLPPLAYERWRHSDHNRHPGAAAAKKQRNNRRFRRRFRQLLQVSR